MSDFRNRTLTVLSVCHSYSVVESACGIDWMRVLQSLATPEDYEDENRRWRLLGLVDDLLPSGQCYTVAQVGEAVSTEAFTEDLEYLAALRVEAEALGLAIIADENGDTLWAVAPVVECVCLGGGHWVVSK